MLTRYKILMTGVTLLLLTSCSTVHKLSTKSSSSSDSTSVTHIDEKASSRHDSSVTKESADTWTRETVIEYDVHDTDVANMGNSQTLFDSSTSIGALNFEPSKFGATAIKNHGRPTRITIRETGTSQAKQSATYTNADTSSKVADNKTEVAKESKEVKTDKKKTGMDFGFWIAAAGVVLVSIGFLWITRKVKKAGDIAKDVAGAVKTVVDQA